MTDKATTEMISTAITAETLELLLLTADAISDPLWDAPRQARIAMLYDKVRQQFESAFPAYVLRNCED